MSILSRLDSQFQNVGQLTIEVVSNRVLVWSQSPKVLGVMPDFQGLANFFHISTEKFGAAHLGQPSRFSDPQYISFSDDSAIGIGPQDSQIHLGPMSPSMLYPNRRGQAVSTTRKSR
jgi:hypothetical protein